MAEEEIMDGGDDNLDMSNSMSSSGGSRSKIVTILIWVVGSIAAIVLMMLIAYLMAKKVKTDSYKEEQNIVIAPSPPPLMTYRFPKQFRVNTADVDSAHFIQMALALGYESENKMLDAELVQRQTQMQHIINIILGGKKKEELTTVLQKLNLAEEIKSQINMILGEGKIEEVYFEELVIS